MAAYNFEQKRWRELPLPPKLQVQGRAWDGSHLVLVGLRDCRPQGVRCASGVPTAAFIEPSGGEWRTIDLGQGRIEVSPEVGWDTSVIGGARDSTFLLEEAQRVVRLTPDGRMTRSARSPGLLCVVGDMFVAVGSRLGLDRSVEPLTPADVRLSTLPLHFSAAQPWTSAEIMLPPVPDPEAEVRAVCGGTGVVLLDVINGRVLTWRPGEASWSLRTLLGDGPLSHNTAEMLQPTSSGDLVGVEHQRETHYVFRLDLDHDGGPRWLRQQAEWVAFSIVGDTVLLYPDQRADERERRRWRLVEAEV